jgi:hypothetical protein
MTFFFPTFFFNFRAVSVGAFSGVENAKMRGSSPEMPKTGSPLAKGELLRRPGLKIYVELYLQPPSKAH